MSHPSALAPVRSLKEFLDSSGLAVPFAIYCAFAAIVYVLQGPEPTLNIDHLSYMKLANEIHAQFPRGDYWRSFTSVRGYGVLLAYLYDFTGSHIVSCKVVLAVLTVAYLLAFQLFMGLATRSRAEAILFSLLSALFVSFGASMWGMTDFSASLNRTVIVPFVVLLAWFFFRRFSSPWRYAVYPALTLLSVLHLSALHVFLVFGVFEMLDFVLRRRFALDRSIFWLAVSLGVSMAIHMGIERSGAGVSNYVDKLIAMAVPPAGELIAPATGGKVAAAKPKGADATKLSAPDAWRIELLAFPWRNLPLPVATIATIALSFGTILMLAALGALRAFRPESVVPLDRQMATLALAVPVAAFGLQGLLWATRSWSAILPINFEEVRAVNMIMLPAIYFTYRLYELAPRGAATAQGALRAAIVIAFALQPIIVLRALPVSWREGIIHQAVALGAVKNSDSPRMLYARQYLGLEDEGRRFYYSARPLMEWLRKNAGPKDKVLSNLNEIYLAGIPCIGPFLTIMTWAAWEPERVEWARSLEDIDRALAAHDLDRVMQLGRSLGATYVVTDWPVEGALYHDQYFSVLRVK